MVSSLAAVNSFFSRPRGKLKSESEVGTIAAHWGVFKAGERENGVVRALELRENLLAGEEYELKW